MHNDENQGQQPPYQGWSYYQEPQPAQPAPPPARPPAQRPNNPNTVYRPGEAHHPYNLNNHPQNPDGPQNPHNPYRPRHPYNAHGPQSQQNMQGMPNPYYSAQNPAFDQMNDAQGTQPPAEHYYPDLTMDMGNSLGYTQGIQYRAISMPQPTQTLRKLRQEQREQKERQERLRRLSQERMNRQQQHRGLNGPPLLSRTGQAAMPQSRSPFAPPPHSPHTPYARPDLRRSGPLAGPGNVPAQAAPAGLQPAAAPAQDTAMIQRVKVARASSLISGAFMLSSLLGLLQTFLFTYIFGRGTDGEAYLQAYIIPNLIYTVIAGGALSSAFIPVFTSYAVKEKDERTAWHIASTALNLSVAGMIAFSLIAIFLAPVLVPLYTRPDVVGLTITLTRIMLIQAIVLGSGVIVGSVLNTKQDFTRTALGTVLYNVGLNLGLVPGFLMTFHTNASSFNQTAIYAATWGVVLGAILQVGVQIPGLSRVNMRYTFVFDWRHPGVIQIARQMVPRVINAMMLSFSTMVDRSLLSFLSDGLINAYLQAFSILLLPVSLFGSSVSTAAFPTLADYASRGRFERVRAIIMETLRGILFLTIPSGVGLIILSFPIAQALLEHGNFDLVATQFAAVALLFFAIGLPFLAAVEILTRSFYALQDSKTPVVISVIQFILKIVLSLILVHINPFGVQWGMGALAFTTSLASAFEAVVLFQLLARRIGGFEIHAFQRFISHALLASGVMAVVLLIAKTILDHLIDTTSVKKLFVSGILMALFKLLIELGAGSLAFLVAARLLKMEEMNTGLVRRVLNLLRIPWL